MCSAMLGVLQCFGVARTFTSNKFTSACAGTGETYHVRKLVLVAVSAVSAVRTVRQSVQALVRFW